MTSINCSPAPSSLADGDDLFRVATLTPIGRAAVSVVGVSGTQAKAALCSCWTRSDGGRSPFFDAEWSLEFASRPFFGRFHFKELDDVADEVVLWWRAPTAFELNCHGGVLASKRIVDFFVKAGARCVPGVEWNRLFSSLEAEHAGIVSHASSDPSLDALFFDAADELIAMTTTEVTARIACSQPNAWRRWFGKLAKAATLGDIRLLVAMVDEVLKSFLGGHLVVPFIVTLCGSPNVGKSSLLNAILGYKRALASPSPGTTLDLVGAPFTYGGWNYLFVDTAGFRETNVALERLGIESAREGQTRADVVLEVYDPTVSRLEQTRVLQHFKHDSDQMTRQVVLKVLNKCDLPQKEWFPDWNAETIRETTMVSAREGDGLSALLADIYRETVALEPDFDEMRRPFWWSDAQVAYLRLLRENALHGNLEFISSRLSSFLT